MSTQVLSELSPFSAWFQVNNLRVTFKFFKEVHSSYLIISSSVKEFLKGHPVLKLSLCTLLPFQCLYPNVFSCCLFSFSPYPKCWGFPYYVFCCYMGDVCWWILYSGCWKWAQAAAADSVHVCWLPSWLQHAPVPGIRLCPLQVNCCEIDLATRYCHIYGKKVSVRLLTSDRTWLKLASWFLQVPGFLCKMVL